MKRLAALLFLGIFLCGALPARAELLSGFDGFALTGTFSLSNIIVDRQAFADWGFASGTGVDGGAIAGFNLNPGSNDLSEVFLSYFYNPSAAGFALSATWANSNMIGTGLMLYGNKFMLDSDPWSIPGVSLAGNLELAALFGSAAVSLGTVHYAMSSGTTPSLYIYTDPFGTGSGLRLGTVSFVYEGLEYAFELERRISGLEWNVLYAGNVFNPLEALNVANFRRVDGPVPTPEPATAALFCLGMAAMIFRARGRRA